MRTFTTQSSLYLSQKHHDYKEDTRSYGNGAGVDETDENLRDFVLKTLVYHFGGKSRLQKGMVVYVLQAELY